MIYSRVRSPIFQLLGGLTITLLVVGLWSLSPDARGDVIEDVPEPSAPEWVAADGTVQLRPDGRPYTTYWIGAHGGLLGESGLMVLSANGESSIYRTGVLLRVPVKAGPPPDPTDLLRNFQSEPAISVTDSTGHVFIFDEGVEIEFTDSETAELVAPGSTILEIGG